MTRSRNPNEESYRHRTGLGRYRRVILHDWRLCSDNTVRFSSEHHDDLYETWGLAYFQNTFDITCPELTVERGFGLGRSAEPPAVAFVATESAGALCEE